METRDWRYSACPPHVNDGSAHHHHYHLHCRPFPNLHNVHNHARKLPHLPLLVPGY